MRVRLPQIENSNLNLFRFDYDLTFMVFFLDSNQKIYARYGGRDSESPDSRQSLAGLRYTMQSVLTEHRSKQPRFATSGSQREFMVQDLSSGRRGRCMHCHQVKESMNRELQDLDIWDVSMAFRFPLPENLGVKLEVDRGDIVERVVEGSVAEKAGLQRGDQLTMLNELPIHSFGDVQFALDTSKQKGSVAAEWVRDGKTKTAMIELLDDWKRSDLSWRTSMHNMVPSSRLDGDNLTAAEKEELGLSASQLAFRQKSSVPSHAADAGILAGDVIYGINDIKLETDSLGLHFYVESHFVKSETVNVKVIRGGKKIELPMLLK